MTEKQLLFQYRKLPLFMRLSAKKTPIETCSVNRVSVKHQTNMYKKQRFFKPILICDEID